MSSAIKASTAKMTESPLNSLKGIAVCIAMTATIHLDGDDSAGMPRSLLRPSQFIITRTHCTMEYWSRRPSTEQDLRRTLIGSEMLAWAKASRSYRPLHRSFVCFNTLPSSGAEFGGPIERSNEHTQRKAIALAHTKLNHTQSMHMSDSWRSKAVNVMRRRGEKARKYSTVKSSTCIQNSQPQMMM